MTMAAGHLSLNEAFGDRFLLGLGVSHQPMVDYVRGHHYDKPLTEDARATSRRWTRSSTWRRGPPTEPRRVLAALGPKMLELAAAQALRRAPVLRARRAHRASPARSSGDGRCSAPSRPWCSPPMPTRPRGRGAPAHGDLPHAARTTRTTCGGSGGATTTSATAAATSSSTPSSRGATRTPIVGPGAGPPRRRRRPRVRPGAAARRRHRAPDGGVATPGGTAAVSSDPSPLDLTLGSRSAEGVGVARRRGARAGP